MKTRFDKSSLNSRARRDGIGTSRWFALGAVAFVAAATFAYFRNETGSAALAISAACMVSIFALLPLRCQLDPCKP